HALGASAPLQIVNAHIAFNVALVILGVPFAGLVHRLVETTIASFAAPATPEAFAAEASALDPSVLDNPPLALANATREVVGICETVEVMLKGVIELYEEPDRARIAALAALDDRVDRRH